VNCPLCNRESRVLRTDDGVRRRECGSCKHRWTTVEIPREQHEQQARVVERVKELAHDVLER